MSKRHPIELRRRLVGRMLGPSRERATDLSAETGIPLGTLSRWKADSLRRPLEAMVTDSSNRTAAEKLRLVLEASALDDQQLGKFLRREGVHEAELTGWRRMATDALTSGQGGTARGQSRRVRDLERELRRKEKALAEVAALLVLQKKVHKLWGDEDDDTR